MPNKLAKKAYAGGSAKIHLKWVRSAICAPVQQKLVVKGLGFTRLNQVIELRHFWVGILKTPMFATVIALIGCLEGFQTQGTAQSVGERTTSAVVQCISLVIILDAMAAVFFMEIKL